MTAYFFDSSALVKRYVTEIGSGWVRSLVMPSANNRIFIAQIAPAELVSAVMRRKREGNLTPRTAKAVRLLLNRHSIREYHVVRFLDHVDQHAQDLLEAHPLRAGDAIQLAAALEINSRLTGANLPPMIFVASDKRLLTVATAEGLTTDDPNQHP